MVVSQALQWAQSFSSAATEYVIVPLLIILSGVAAGKVLGNLVIRIGTAVQLDKHGKTVLGQRLPMTELLSGSVAAVVYTVAAVWALVEAGIARELFLIIIGALLMLGVLGLVLWLGDAVPNLLAGRRLRNKFSEGDSFTRTGVSGTVEHVGRLSLWVKTPHGRLSVPYRGL